MKYCSILPALLLLAACSQEEPADSSLLPDGTYPIVFTARICGAEPQSRVSETGVGKSVWDPGDKFKAKVINGDAEMESTYSMSGTGYVSDSDPKLYWRSNEDAYVTAWYSNITGQSTVPDNKTVALDDQSSRLAYVLRATATVPYKSAIELEFRHQLARIVVVIEGEGALYVSSVKVKNYTSCTISEGEVSPETPGLITMRKKNDLYEACVVPGAPIPPGFITLITPDNDSEVEIEGITEPLEAGKVYTVTVNVRFPVEKDINGHKAVLMRKATADLPALYFATCNIGADTPEDAGLYFWWGDVIGHTANEDNTVDFDFSEGNNKIVTVNKSIDELRSAGYIDDKDNLVSGMDAARQHWGGSWRMPTKEDIEWLQNTDNCAWSSNAAGTYVKSSSTGGVIFLPKAGVCSEKTRLDYGEEGFYWHSTAFKNDPVTGGCMDLSRLILLNDDPYFGLSVRPVSN